MTAADTVRELATKSLPWIPADDTNPVVMSTRVRVARNLADLPFPNRLGATDRRRVRDELTHAIAVAAPHLAANSYNLSTFNQLQLKLLRERSLITRTHARTRSGAALAIDPSPQLSVLVNEDDHLRIQVLLPGTAVDQGYQRATEIETDLRDEVAFAKRDGLGFLCANPLNAGTGLRVSAMMHLPALAMADELDAVGRAADALGFTITGSSGPNSPPTGCLFQLATRAAGRTTEEAILKRAAAYFAEIEQLELDARQRLLETRPEILYDHVSRGWAILRSAHLLDSEEATNYLMSLRLGVCIGTFAKLDFKALSDLLAMVRPAHLQFRAGRPLNKFERDVERARRVRETLAGYCAS